MDDTIDENYKSWMVKTIASKQKKIYINSCKLSPINIEISFLARKEFMLGEKEDTF